MFTSINTPVVFMCQSPCSNQNQFIGAPTKAKWPTGNCFGLVARLADTMCRKTENIQTEMKVSFFCSSCYYCLFLCLRIYVRVVKEKIKFATFQTFQTDDANKKPQVGTEDRNWDLVQSTFVGAVIKSEDSCEICPDFSEYKGRCLWFGQRIGKFILVSFWAARPPWDMTSA